MKLILLILLAGIPILAAAEESFFFTYTKKPGSPEKRLEGDQLHTVQPIQKIDPPEATFLSAFHQGLGKGREYQIQIDLKGPLEERWYPMVKLGDDLITSGIMFSYSDSKKWPSTMSIESDDPEKIRSWSRQLGSLLKLPEDQIDIDLAKTEEEEEDDDPAAVGEGEEGGDGNLGGASEWKLKQGLVISLRESEKKEFSFHDPAGKELFRLEKHERVRGVAAGPQGGALLFLINHEDGFGGCLLRVAMRGEVPRFERVLAHPATPLFEGKRWWISDLGAVSDDGDVVLAKIGWMPRQTGRVSYEWQTWSIGREKRLGSGLQIGNGEIEGGR